MSQSVLKKVRLPGFWTDYPIHLSAGTHLLLRFPPAPLRQQEPDLLFSEKSNHPEQVSLWKYSISSPHAKLLFYSL